MKKHTDGNMEKKKKRWIYGEGCPCSWNGPALSRAKTPGPPTIMCDNSQLDQKDQTTGYNGSKCKKQGCNILSATDTHFCSQNTLSYIILSVFFIIENPCV